MVGGLQVARSPSETDNAIAGFMPTAPIAETKAAGRQTTPTGSRTSNATYAREEGR